MLKNFIYGGSYYDNDISVGILLENPLECGFGEDTLVFSITIRRKNENVTTIKLEDFTFYIMDESNRLYNTRSKRFLLPFPEALLRLSNDGNLIQPAGLIFTDFKSCFLFQDLRIAFYYHPYQKIKIIELKH